MIKIESLKKSYAKNEVLKNINLEFRKGEINGIVGNNGAGKTTLFHCIADLEYFEGKISYNDKRIRDVLGFLPTNPQFMSKITGLEYLQLLCNAREIKIKNIKEKNIFELPLERYANTYSTGMKKKLALTALLLQKNDIFILDEPFNGVDIHSNIILEEVFQKLKEMNKIVIISSHIFSTLKTTCDHLHYLKDGEIVKSVEKENFSQIEKEMKASGISLKLDLFEL